MPNTFSWPYGNMQEWQKKILTGFKPGEMHIISAGRGIGKSMLTKAWLNQKYGKVSDMGNIVTQFTVTKAYKGEWKVELPWYRQADSSMIKNFEAWCQETMGQPGRHGRYRWRKAQLKYGTYFIRNEQDLIMVTLKWTGV